MKVDGNIRSVQSGTVSETQTRGNKGTSTAGTAGANGGGPRIELSPLGSQLAGIEASLADVPVVDAQRVEEIKLAISEGRFTVNSEVIADKLIETVQELILAQQGK